MSSLELVFCLHVCDGHIANRVSRQWAGVIQPLALRAPEVLIDAPWDTKTDIWNFGCLVRLFCSMHAVVLTITLQMYELARGSALFDPTWQNAETGMDATETHLSQMSGLFGEFPTDLLAKGKKTSTYFDPYGLFCATL